MNIFRREMKTHRKGLFFWSLGMVFMVMSGMAKFAAYEQAGQSVEEIMGALPRAVRIIFGLSSFDLTKASGFYGVLFLYLAVMGAIHAVLLGSGVIAEEERDRTSEFLFAKPISRSHALTSKLAAGLTNIVLLNLVTLVSSFVFVDYYGKGENVTSEVLLLMAGLLFLQLIFFALGALIAGTARKPRSASGRATTVMLLSFVLFYMVNFNEKLSALRFFTPFKYFDAADLLEDMALDPVSVVVSVAIIVLALAGTYRFFGSRDLRA